MRVLGDGIQEGDVILSNHPCAGGSHLPDLTVITPVSHPSPVNRLSSAVKGKGVFIVCKFKYVVN
jgi:hypothetical protein